MQTNKIYNVDCYEFIKTLPDKSIDCIYTDIPYLYLDRGCDNSEFSQKIKKKFEEIENFVDGIDMSILYEFKRILKKFNCFIWLSKLQIPDVLNFCVKNGYYFEILVWCKTNPQPATNGTWLPDMEYCIYIRESGVKLNNGIEYKNKYYFDKMNVFDKKLFDHPTIKPYKLVERHLLHTTQENDIVFDPFIGSGTTAVACQNTKRQFIGCEIEKKYYDIAIKRLNNETSNGQISMFTF